MTEFDLSGNSWTPGRLAFLGRHYGKGRMSSTDIARELKLTRSAVCGMANRLGLSEKARVRRGARSGLRAAHVEPHAAPIVSPQRPTPEPRGFAPVVARPPKPRRLPSVRPTVPAPRVAPRVVADPGEAYVTAFFDRRDSQCPALLNRRGAAGERLCCGAPIETAIVGEPTPRWCGFHRLKYTVPTPGQISRRPVLAPEGGCDVNA
jgi:hypothetical protein